MNKIIIAIGTAALTAVVMAAPNAGRPVQNQPSQGPRPVQTQMRQSAPQMRQSAPQMQQKAPQMQHNNMPRMQQMQNRGPQMNIGGGHNVGVVRQRPPTRHWARPAMPPPRPYAVYGWTWVASPWTILVNGVYCTGDGYWYDGYNYYYNNAYYTTAPVSVTVVW